MAEIHRIYSYEDYRGYLSSSLELPELGRGSRKKLAEHLNCQSSFVSQVLSGKNELSLEHAFDVNRFLGHAKDESNYFLNMVQLSRAGTKDLERHFRTILGELKEEKLQVSEVTEKAELSETVALEYFGNWLCISIHMLVAVKELRTPEKMRKYLGAGEKEFDKALAFLTQKGLIMHEGGMIFTGKQKVHLSKNSPYAQAASIIYRQQILSKIVLKDPQSLNYVNNMTIPRKAFGELKKKILKLVSEVDKTVAKGEAETFCTLVIDFLEHKSEISN